MNKKTVKRIIMIALVVSMGSVYLAYRTGMFNKLLISKKPDVVTSASVNSGHTPGVVTSASASAGQKPDGEGSSTSSQIQNTGESVVSIVRSDKKDVKDIGYDEIRRMVREAIDLAGGLEGVVKDNQVVVLKPNLVQMHVDSTGELFDKEINGATTDYRVVKAVAEMVREYNPNGKIYIMEGSAGDKTKKTMNYLNYTKEFIPYADEFIALEDDSGGWQEFDSPNLIKVDLPNGLLHKQYYANKKYYDCDVLISIPCLKTNSGSVISGSAKNVGIGSTPANIYGVNKDNPSRTKMVSHKITDGELDKWIYDYFMIKPVNFVVMDGLQGFQNGPVPMGKANVKSDRMNMRLIVASRDSVAHDAVEALIAGWDPRTISYLINLSSSGMGNLDTSKIRVVGKYVDEVRKPFLIKFSNLGGVKVGNPKPPEISIIKKTIKESNFEYEVKADNKAVKIEAYVDGRYAKTIFPKDFKRFSIPANENQTVKLTGYDVFLNHVDIVEGSILKDDAKTYLDKKAALLESKDMEGLIEYAGIEEPAGVENNRLYYELPKKIAKFSHDRAMQAFNSKDNKKARKYVEYGLNEYAKVFIKKPLTDINAEDITVKASDSYKDQKLTYNDFILFYNNYAYFILQTGADTEAEPLLRKVAEIAPTRAVAYIDLGNVCWNLGKKEEAKVHYRKYLELLGKNTSKVPKEIYDRLEE